MNAFTATIASHVMNASSFFDQLLQPGKPVTPTPLDSVATIELFIGLCLIVLFTIVYGVAFTWWRTRAGRGVLFVFVAISLLLGYIVVGHFAAGNYEGRDIIRVIVYLLLPGTMCYLFYALVRNYFAGPSQIRIDPTPLVHPRRRNGDTASTTTPATPGPSAAAPTDKR